MSFTDGKPRVATKEDANFRWGGHPAGEWFRCYMCGHRFKVGDVWRWVYANFGGSVCTQGNFFVCFDCDGNDVLERRAQQEAEFKAYATGRFWSFQKETE